MKTKTIFTLLILALTACAPALTPAPTGTSVPTAVVPTSTSTGIPVTATATMTVAQQPPVCTFPLAQTTTEESKPEEYTFSEPKVVLHPTHNEAETNVIGWLPDNQRILLVQNFQDSTSQTTEILDTQTSKVQIYSRKPNNSFWTPVWVEELNAVVYPNTFWLSPSIFDSNGVAIVPTSSVVQRQLVLSHGEPEEVQLIEDAQFTFYNGRSNATGAIFRVAVNSDSNEIAYIDDEFSQLYLRKAYQGALGAAQQSAFDSTKWNIALGLEINWRANTSQILAYGYPHLAAIYSYVLDTQSGEICKLNLYRDERFAKQNYGSLFSAKWSSNGRYLAVVMREQPGLESPTSLVVLDTATGALYQMNADKFTPAGMKALAGKHYVYDVSWVPDNHHLLVLGEFRSFQGCAQNCFGYENLYLADFKTGAVTPILSNHEFGHSNEGSIAWSLDGSKIFAMCKMQGLCVISVQGSGQ